MPPRGFLLVGGNSSRMGQDKALLPWHGEPLLCSLAHRLAAVTTGVTLLGDPARYAAFNYPILPDAAPGAGPLAGLLTALRHTTAEWNLVLACDLPAVPVSLLQLLISRSPQASAQCLVPTAVSGPQPLCALYHHSCLPAFEQAWAAQQRSVRRLLSQLSVELIDVPEEWLVNVNTPAEWESFRASATSP